jgi:hypothetical protein
MEISYYLLSTAGVDVIIIPELDCRINVIEPGTEVPDPAKGKQIIFANVLNRELAFQAVGDSCPDIDYHVAAIRWYTYQKTFPKKVA